MRMLCARCCAVCATLALVFAACEAVGQANGEESLGHHLFHRNWAKFDHLSQGPRGGDGLGPMYNAVSCVACHNQGGSGGGGEAEHNVQLVSLSAMHVEPDKRWQAANLANAAEMHNGFRSTSSIVLHKHSDSPQYEDTRAALLKLDPVNVLGLAPISLLPTAANLGRAARRGSQPAAPVPGKEFVLAMVRSERNTPALFGLKQIDQIPVGVLHTLAKRQKARFEHISGRVAGKFGWRGQTATLRDFILGACANELGLQTRGFAQADDPTGQSRANNSTDMFREEVTALVSYVESLPAPKEVKPQSAALRRGREFFLGVGCATCHMPEVHNVAGIYSDLLLHDLGPGLIDPAALTPSQTPVYYGTGQLIAVTDEQKQEWRTPPLWGVRHSAPYLHDGRAATIEEAVKWHAGEAEETRQLYNELPEQARVELVNFVRSIGAP